jgi:hypothetical protein
MMKRLNFVFAFIVCAVAVPANASDARTAGRQVTCKPGFVAMSFGDQSANDGVQAGLLAIDQVTPQPQRTPRRERPRDQRSRTIRPCLYLASN